VNEPFIVTAFGYALGSHAPGKTLMLDALATAHHQLLGHGLANSALRAAGVREVAITNNYTPAWPASDSPSDIAATAAYDALHNWTFTDPVLLGSYPVALSAFGVGPDGPDCARDGDLAIISAPVDALGVNYYNPTQISAPATASAAQSAQPEFARADSGLPFQFEPISGYPVTAFGWPVIPAGLTEILTTLAGRYGAKLPPVYITENGCSVADQPDDLGGIDDQPRISYLDGHIRAVADAIAAGVDVRGYLVWTLMDNFEWAEGYHQRFGLVHVDFETQRRTPKSSFDWYRDLIAAQQGRLAP
jgi:beta-glucosidase